MSEAKASQMTLNIPVADHPTDWFGEPIVIEREIAQGVRIPLPDEEQPTIGDRLRLLLNLYRCDEKPTMVMWAERLGRQIAASEKAKRPYVAHELALKILRDAWKQNAALPADHPARLPGLISGTLARMIGLMPPDEGLSTVGLEIIEDEESMKTKSTEATHGRG